MKLKIKFLFFLFLSKVSFSQTTVYSDNMENSGRTWRGVPRMLINSYYTGGNSGRTNFPNNSNYFSSSDSCFALFGAGQGNSGIERDTLSYLNVSGLDPNAYYRFKVKVASFALNPLTNTAAGVDNTDYIQIDYSSDGGLTFIKEIRLTGSNNRRWNFVGGISLGKVANGGLNTFTSIRTSIYLDLPLGITQFAGNIIMVCNVAGESWMIDDVELIKLSTLPIELLSFNANVINDIVYLNWSTASEINNNRFEIYKSTDNINYELLKVVLGNGTTTQTNYYSIADPDALGIIYYKLVQIDFDGTEKEYDPIVIKVDGILPRKVIKIINLLGQEVDENYEGYKIFITK